MEEDFSSGVHTWPGLDDRFNKTLTGLYSFYMQVSVAANYTLRVNATGSIALYVTTTSSRPSSLTRIAG